MLGVGLVYAGLMAILLGGVSLLKPLAFLGIRTRLQGLLIAGAGLVVLALGGLLPTSETRVTQPHTHLDEFAPVYQFSEVHRTVVRAPRDRVYQAIQAVTADEILLFRTLTWIRRFGQRGPENILKAPERMPILEVATRTSFLMLAEEREREIVVGTIVLAPSGSQAAANRTPEAFRALAEPGFAKAAMNFLLEDAAPGTCLLITETRVYATDAAARRKFARYWRVIYPGSALIRRMWLRAVKLRAEAANP